MHRQFSPTREQCESADWRRFGVSAWGIAITNDMRTLLISAAAAAAAASVPGPSDCCCCCCRCASSARDDSGTGPRRKRRLQVRRERSWEFLTCLDDDVSSASTDKGYGSTILAWCWQQHSTAQHSTIYIGGMGGEMRGRHQGRRPRDGKVRAWNINDGEIEVMDVVLV